MQFKHQLQTRLQMRFGVTARAAEYLCNTSVLSLRDLNYLWSL